MTPYILRRLILVVPTLIGIITINFFLVQMAPGGPLETMIARITGEEVTAESRALRQEDSDSSLQIKGESAPAGKSEGAENISPELMEKLRELYGFDKPLYVRYLTMLRDFAVFDFGDSFFIDKSVLELIKEKMPVSISLGIWSTLLVYLVSIPLGIAKSVRHGSRFDIWSSFAVIIGSAVPVFLFAVILVILFAGGNYFAWFPLRGLVSDGFADMTIMEKILDYLWHMCLPVFAMLIGSFASLTMLTKNSFLDEIGKQYVLTARAKGLKEKTILYGHVFRNSMLIVISGFPAAFISMFFTGSLLIEVIFSLDGLGLMGFEATMSRDYPVMFSTLYVFTLLGLVLNILSDITYCLVDPRINFNAASRG
ncbi:binding-protein-dependent transport systems inner membrane component [Denitrovibrio acetiphilus DSM 12809]|uniref:Binding-protein-dependent transport systems inner membrane component n=1 Tax=Denitrovibrio acetiphilus (strain DSM 12809 / NBRC 114555 / N2460) TaxID=522772 RepID=D4H6N5_DENA2|nr:microcin C ABC transporter permease YejB [Denitrovibrio acetiphilus]ADD67751.1 binding-protein-dependent transport systems inner membrane component [Denitrovibrio acetiphilus DSM 12809]